MKNIFTRQQIEEQTVHTTSRFFRRSFAAGAASAFTIIRPELVRGAGEAKLKVGLVGCGGRGTGAVVREPAKIIVGGPSVKVECAEEIRADGHSENADAAMQLARRFVEGVS